MKNRSMLVAAIWAALAQPVLAQPGATEPSSSSIDDESDGPEAKSVLSIKIGDLIKVAVMKSPDLSIAKINRVAAIQTAEGSRRGQSWLLDASIAYTNQGVADHVDVPPFSVVGQAKTDTELSLGRQLPTGGQIQFSLGFIQTNAEYNVPDNLAMGQTPPAGFSMDLNGNLVDQQVTTTATAGISMTQPLMRGLGSTVALADQHRADLQALESTIKAQLAAEKLILDLVTAYWDLAYAAYEVDIRLQAIDLGKKQEQLTHEQMRAGQGNTASISSVNYDLAQRQSDLLTAQITVEQKSLELRQKAGLELSKRDILMQPSEPFDIGNADFNVDEVLARAKVANHQLADYQIQKKLADVEVAVAEDQTKPKLDLQLQAALNGNADSTGGAIGGLTSGDGYQIGATLKMEVELSGAARKMRDAKVSLRRRIDFDIAAAERDIETKTVTAVHTVTAAKERIALADKSISVAEDNVRAERNNFMVGRSTNLQVMQTQTRLIDARLGRGKAVADYHKAVAQLQYLSGALLEQYNVDVHPHR